MSDQDKDTSSRPKLATAAVTGGGGVSASLSRAAQLSHISTLSSIALQRSQFGLRFGFGLDGLSYDGRRDLYQSMGFSRFLTPQMHYSRFRRGGIAHSIVTAYPNATWSGGADIIEDQDAEDYTPWESDVLALFKKFSLWNRILRADILAQISGYSVILIGAPGLMGTELPQMRSINDIKYFSCLPSDRARIASIDQNPESERFGLPEFYTCYLGTPNYSQVSNTMYAGNNLGGTVVKRVHHSRIIHIAEGLLEDEIFGILRLEACWNLLDTADKIAHGGGEAAFRRMDPGTVISLPPDALLADGEEAAMTAEAEDFYNGISRTMQLRGGAEITLLQAKAENFGPNIKAIVELISGTTRIPQRIFFGSERGELASSQDSDNWEARKGERRKEYAVPIILYPLLGRLMDYGALPTIDEFHVTWPDIEELDEKDKSIVTSNLALANRNQKLAGGKLILTGDEIRSKVWNMEPIEIDPEKDLAPIPESVADPNAASGAPKLDAKGNPLPAQQPAADKPGQPVAKAAAADDNFLKWQQEWAPHYDQLFRNLAPLPLHSEEIGAGTKKKIVIVGGPRRGKSTLARNLRLADAIPTYCTDPLSLVKDPEPDVTYLPEEYAGKWSESSQYVADEWLAKLDGPYCLEGVATARALRKYEQSVDGDPAKLSELQVVVLTEARVPGLLQGQESMAKGVDTVWQQIAGSFPDAHYVMQAGQISDPVKVKAASKVSKKVKPVKGNGYTGVKVAVKHYPARPDAYFKRLGG